MPAHNFVIHEPDIFMTLENQVLDTPIKVICCVSDSYFLDYEQIDNPARRQFPGHLSDSMLDHFEVEQSLDIRLF